MFFMLSSLRMIHSRNSQMEINPNLRLIKSPKEIIVMPSVKELQARLNRLKALRANFRMQKYLNRVVPKVNPLRLIRKDSENQYPN